MSISSLRRFAASAALTLVLSLVLVPSGVLAGDKALTYEDLMKFRTIHGASISDDGSWIAYELRPDRGDGQVVARSTDGLTEVRVERGTSPALTTDGHFLAATIKPTLAEQEKAAEAKGKNGKNGKKDGPKNGLSLVDLRDGSERRIERVAAFAFSDDGRFLAYRHFPEEKEEKDGEDGDEAEETGEEKTAEEPEKPETEDEERKKKDDELGTKLVLLELASGEETVIEHVTEMSFDEPSTTLVVTVSAPEGDGDGLYAHDLESGERTALASAPWNRYTHPTWAKDRTLLAFLEAPTDDDGETGDAALYTWNGSGDAVQVASRDDAPEGFTLPSKNELRWTRDGARLFFGFKPTDDEEGEDEKKDDDANDDADDEEETGTEEETFDAYDLDALLDKRTLDVWHWNDPLIKTHAKEQWDEEKDRVYRAILHRGDGEGRGKIVALADLEMRHVEPSENPAVALGAADKPYLKEITWNGWYADAYIVDLASGERHRFAEHLSRGFGGQGVSLAPDGRHVIYYDAGHWHLYDVSAKTTRNVTQDLDVPFADEDHDYPSDPPGYGTSEWLADGSAIFVYDKYDIWRVSTDGSEPANITEVGRERETVFRILDLAPDEEVIEPASTLLLSAYHDKEKHEALYGLSLGVGVGLTPLDETKKHRVNVVAKAENADKVLFTRERYDEFPDLRVARFTPGSEPRLGPDTVLSDANPQVDDYAWGSAELVSWTSLDGRPLQGVLIKPGNYEEGKRYPVLVYYYRFFTQRLHQFNEPVVNHRPSFPLYASNGYAVFLPDIRFEVGRPGLAATKSLVPGVQKLIEMGIADPGALGLHGHSWSGYQTAFMITQTNLFAAAVAGAPVSNMTSAYSGIRWGSGLARQFQYEKSQSRIGGSLWEYPERYIENSPVFFADRIETPLLIQFGDEDEAVPWTQGIELYLACRRLEKNCIFLQYRGEPHHLKKYANKLDYSMKMKAFFDHHLKGEPAPEWMTEGVSYRGE